MKKRVRPIGIDDANGKLSLDRPTLEARLLRVRSHVRAGLVERGEFPAGPVAMLPCDQATKSEFIA